MYCVVVSSWELCLVVFFFNDTATTELYTLSLHDALPIWIQPPRRTGQGALRVSRTFRGSRSTRSEEHTSELQSQSNLVCRLLLEKKNKNALNFFAPILHSDSLPHRHEDFTAADAIQNPAT